MQTTRVMLAVFALLLVGHARSSDAQTSQPKTFSSAGEASEALFQAVRSHDERAIAVILGAGKDVTSSGDDEEDTLEREHFGRKYQEMHRLVREPDGTTVLYIGAENWPFPIPLTSRNGRWAFDTRTGTQEMLFRRIGENEATALEVCRALVTTEGQTQSTTGSDDPIAQYAGIVAHAAATGATPEPQRFHGYYFRALGLQPAKRLHVFEGHVSGGKSTDVLAFVAYPAEYRSSGVMTFLVAKNGTLYQRDLGPDTLALAQAIRDRKPAAGWRVVKAIEGGTR